MVSYFTDLDSRTKIEQEAKESLWTKKKGVENFRDCIKYLFKLEDIDEDELIESLVIAKEGIDRQNFFVNEVRELKFATAKKSTLDKLHDGEIPFD